MPVVSVPFADQSVSVDAPADLMRDLAAFFPFTKPSHGPPAITITTDGADRFLVTAKDAPPRGGLSKGEALDAIRTRVPDAAEHGSGVVFRAGAVGWNDKAILVTGWPGRGATSLVAWLVEAGFAYIADDAVVVDPEAGTAAGFTGPFSLPQLTAAHLSSLAAFHEAPSVPAGNRLLIAPHPTWLAPEGDAPIGLILTVVYEPGAPLSLRPIDRPAYRLLEATRTIVLPSQPAFARVTALAGTTPALALRYGDYGQLAGVLDFLCRTLIEAPPEPAELARFLGALIPRQVTAPASAAAAQANSGRRIPPRTNRSLDRRLTIGMSTYDDFDGTYFSIQALRMYHPEVMDEVELIVVDNHPDGLCAEPLQHLDQPIPNFRYVPYPDAVGTAASRERMFAEASGEIVLCIDCHVFIVPGALRRLLDFFSARPGTRDLVQGPMVSDDLKSLSTHFAPGWREGMYGLWGTDPRAADPDAPAFDIPSQGLGLFACRKEAWPGFNPLFHGFGGEEGYIHEKVRRGGGRTLCLPFLRWMHRFQRPLGVPYPNRWEDRFRNYLIGFRELGWPTDAVEAHCIEKMGLAAGSALIANVKRELGEPEREHLGAL